MRVVSFRHMCSDGLCALSDTLDEKNIPYHYIDTYRDDLAVYDPLDENPLIILGGTCGVYQMEDYPFLKDELNVLEKRLAADLPTLGICLGAQLMAKALGAKVEAGTKGPEIGWYDISVNEAGMNSPVRHFDKQYTKMMQWHGDTFDLSSDMVRLASSEQYQNQAFSYGKNAIGVQFHPEVRPCTLKGWYVSAAGDVANGTLDLPKMRADTEANIDRMSQQARLFIGEWLGNVAQS